MLDGRENFRECTAEDVGYAGAVVLPGGTDGFFSAARFLKRGPKRFSISLSRCWSCPEFIFAALEASSRPFLG